MNRECHPERSEGSVVGLRIDPFAALRMTLMTDSGQKHSDDARHPNGV